LEKKQKCIYVVSDFTMKTFTPNQLIVVVILGIAILGIYIYRLLHPF